MMIIGVVSEFSFRINVFIILTVLLISQTIKKNRNPRWDEHFSYMIDEPPLQEKLHVEVFSKHRTFGFMRKVRIDS